LGGVHRNANKFLSKGKRAVYGEQGQKKYTLGDLIESSGGSERRERRNCRGENDLNTLRYNCLTLNAKEGGDRVHGIYSRRGDSRSAGGEGRKSFRIVQRSKVNTLQFGGGLRTSLNTKKCT